ncbi:MAG: single-stranded-DNA-specific exonuclease RecJ [bacterium]|nr:single-stranded-DNA-specific exonuclease RecJ [bacterium]
MPHWLIAGDSHPEVLQEFTRELGLPPVVSKILINRGIHSREEARKFFKPAWEDLYDPFRIKDMDKAVDRLSRAVRSGERVLIYGDYDVDGITSVSLLYLFIRQIGGNVGFYIPDRLKEGYGLSAAGVRQAAAEGATLLVTVDCGITGVEEIRMARGLGLDVIVSDHHEQANALPEAAAILNPKRNDCTYPFKELAGVGVAFKFVQAMCRHLGLEDEAARQYIDLVALGSAADIVPLVDENRILVKLGMERMNRLERPGIRALAETSGILGKPIGTGQVVFILAPRINAVGRLGNAQRAVQLLISGSEEESRVVAQELEAENRNRKNLDDMTFQEAKGIIETEGRLDSRRTLVLAKEGWHPGVIGIVASRIVEQYCRPTVMIALDGDTGKGSARSIASFDIHSALKQCEDLLASFGGHQHAAGLLIRKDCIEPFRERFERIAAEQIREDDLTQRIQIDAEIALPDITDRFIRLLNGFAPFGPQNMRPVFLARNLNVVGSPRVVGRNHLKFKVRQGGDVHDAIGFDLGELIYRLSPGDSNLDMVFVVEENHWNDEVRTQLRVKDLR